MVEIMIDKLLQEEKNKIRMRTKMNQKIHLQYVEEAKRKESYENSQNPPRFPNEFNKRYSDRK